MGREKIYGKDESFIIANVMDDVENVDAREYFTTFHANSIYPIIENITMLATDLDSLSQTPDAIALASLKLAEEEINRSASLEIPDNITRLFKEKLSKKEQISLLKGVSICTNQLATIFIYAGDQGYKFSSYRFEDTPKKYVGADLPSFIHLNEEGEVEHYGETALTDGQMKELVYASRFVLARILNNGTHWHCFYQVKQGIQGKEHGELGRHPHIHYISDSFGISLDDIVKGFKGGICPHSKVHILLDE